MRLLTDTRRIVKNNCDPHQRTYDPMFDTLDKIMDIGTDTEEEDE